MAKKILITISNASVTRNMLRSQVLEDLTNPQNAITLVVPPDKYGDYRKEFERENVKVLVSPPIVLSFPELVLSFFARNAFGTETIRMWQIMEMHWNKRYLLFIIKRFLWMVFGRSKLFHGLIRFLYGRIAPQKTIAEFLKKEKPDLLFVPDAFGDIDVPFWQAARRLKIKTLVMVRSWDNLSNHGLVRMVPEKLIVHNPFLKRLAMDLHHIPESKIAVVGLPHYDWYADEKLSMPRDAFFKKIGIDPRHKYILHAGIGDYLAPHDGEVAKILSERIEKGEFKFPSTVLFRPHPAFAIQAEENVKGLRHVIFDHRILKDKTKNPTGEMTQEDMAHLLNSLRHADLVITTASTITIDAIAFGRPVICIGFDGESKEPYWNSVLRFYRDFTHYKLISQTGGFKIAYNGDELTRSANAYLTDPGLDAKGRKKIFDDFIWKLDGRSAERLSKVILEQLTK